MVTNVRRCKLDLVVSHLRENFSFDAGKKVKRALSFLTAFLASVLLNQIGVEGVSGGYHRYTRRNM
jgi:hypothetical protein